VLSYDVFFVILGLAIFVELRLVFDKQTDRQTHDDSIYRASIASRGKNKLTQCKTLFCCLEAERYDLMNSSSETIIDKPSPAIKM